MRVTRLGTSLRAGGLLRVAEEVFSNPDLMTSEHSEMLGGMSPSVIPDIVPVLVEDESRVGLSNRPGVLFDLMLELVRSPAGVAESHENFGGPFLGANVPQDLEARCHRQAIVDRDGLRATVIGAVHDEADFRLDRAAQEHAHLAGYVAALLAWYLHDTANIAYAHAAPDGGDLRQPVLFINGGWDLICDVTRGRLGEPMRRACRDLSLTNMEAGHWLPLERKTESVQAIRSWLKTKTL